LGCSRCHDEPEAAGFPCKDDDWLTGPITIGVKWVRWTSVATDPVFGGGRS
jgi:hypothetical protein